jgi:ubiquitin-protein ligase E3 C
LPAYATTRWHQYRISARSNQNDAVTTIHGPKTIDIMHQTFSGASRRPRQVNLSGRPKVSNPFAPSSGAHNALQNAQQERERRQRERDRLNAASLIQRSWRRYTTRKELAAARRQSWDERELEAAEPGVPPTLEHCRSYATESEAFSQLDLLLRFLDKSDQQDILRIQLFLARLALLSRQSGGAPSGGKWPGAYLRLQHTILAVIQQELTHNGVFEDEMLLEGLVVAIEMSSDLTAQHAARLYRHLGAMLKAISKDPSRHQLLSQYMLRASLAPLKDMTAGRLPAYEAFAVEFLTLSDLTKAPLAPECLNKLADEVNYKLLAKVLATSLMPQIQGQQKTFSNSRSRANLLASLIYFYRLGRRFQISFTDDDYMIVVSTLLNSIASVSGAKKSASEYDDEEPSPFTFDADGGDDAFVQEQINSLADSDSIDGFLGSKSVSSISGLADMDEHTEHIASFALTLLRFFPHKGDEVRIRLYMASGGVDPDHPSEKMPAIRYFWKAARASRVFNDIRKDADSVIPLLKSRSRSDGLDDLQDSWRVILIFMELYSFVLKLMDDEEFFSHADSLRRTSTWASQNALPLDEVSDLTLFLKNLGFVLYFDAASIRKIYGRPRDGSLSSYFGPSQSRIAEPSDMRDSEVSIAGLAGIGIDYVKGLVTGLLRMLYERDSRRQFLPNDHWLMTSRFDMQSFIPSVVEEEQSRHRIEENDEDDEEESVSVGGHAGRTVHMQRLRRQQRQLSRQRQMQAIAPRLEILQNMPFFIPFETRVRIFREFVALDKVSHPPPPKKNNNS